ncbi:unnamed protein product [Mytilus coruscus]|uniref:Uncharacterized protein n=1 Tax=Mytilus coruscus TaxID=42192 RepID=A0A6J8CFS6_MYTCO|nr:unnamed protein product [Mytilus coruscus]
MGKENKTIMTMMRKKSQKATEKTREQNVSVLELMLGQIAKYCPIISRNTIVKNSTSINNIWQTVRPHYGFQITGAHFVDFDAIHYDPDSLLRKDMGITRHDEDIEDDKELSPTLENLLILTWLRLIHPELPKLIKQRYGTELRARTPASIKPEISQALESLLVKLRTTEDAKSIRAAAKRFPKTKQSSFVPCSNFKSYPLCKSAGGPDRHFLRQCTYLPQQNRQCMAKSRAVTDIHDVDEYAIQITIIQPFKTSSP